MKEKRDSVSDPSQQSDGVAAWPKPPRPSLSLPCRRSSGLKATTFDIRSKPPREKQYDEDDHDDSDHTDTAMTITIPVATKSTAETTKQKDDKEDDEYEPDRHDLPPVAAPIRLNWMSADLN